MQQVMSINMSDSEVNSHTLENSQVSLGSMSGKLDSIDLKSKTI